VPRGLAVVIEKATAEDRDERYECVADLGDALAAVD
jgi:hypothetical protein